jgi:predicted nucleotidyltransferase
VRSLGIFGFFVRGEQQTRSDLDVLVEFDRAPTLFGFIDLSDHLTELLGVKVDLVMKSALKPTIGSFILAEVVPV